MKTSILAVLLLVTTVWGNSLIACGCCASSSKKQTEDKSAVKKQTTCPVMNEEIKPADFGKYFVDVKGKRIYTCCPMCIKKVKKDPEKYIKILKDKGQPILELKKQTTCSVMGGKISKKHYVDVDGKRIYVCCPGCISKIKQDPDKYIKKLEKNGITLEKVPKKNDSTKKETQKQNCH